MEYNENNNQQNNFINDLIPVQYYYTNTFRLNSLVDNLLDNLQNNENLNFNPVLYSSFYFRINNINQSNNSEDLLYNVSNTYFPSVTLIERIFNDYIENKNKLTDEDYKNNIEIIEEKLEECPVCFDKSEICVQIKKCKHVFCEDCIQTWLKNHKNSCPICRVNVINN